MTGPLLPEPATLTRFARGSADASQATPDRVGSKAASLIRMATHGLPVPSGFVLTTDVWRAWARGGRTLPDSVPALLEEGIRFLEQSTGLRFGAERRPLLLSVRSGAPVSMPGMMDSVLDVGFTKRTADAMVRMSGNPRHAWDSYRRLVQTFAEVVHGIPAEPFERALAAALEQAGVPDAAELDASELQALTEAFRAIHASTVRRKFPDDPFEQLSGAVEAVLRSWDCPRARDYRRLQGIPDDSGTAVVVQAMVFGNAGGQSGSGVGFTRDPSTGTNTLFVDFVRNGQGEDVVSGRCAVCDAAVLEQHLPDVHAELVRHARTLERLFGDVQDFEFTVQEGTLWLLQSRDAKRTPIAAVRIACALVEEGLIDPPTALERLRDVDLETVHTKRIVADDGRSALARGTPACPGIATGHLVLDPAHALVMRERGHDAILVRQDIAPHDIAAIAAAAGVLTARGGRTSHAAVVARELDRVCVVGCRELRIDAPGDRCRIGDRWLETGELVSLDGTTGDVYAGTVRTVVERPERELDRIRSWPS